MSPLRALLASLALPACALLAAACTPLAPEGDDDAGDDDDSWQDDDSGGDDDDDDEVTVYDLQQDLVDVDTVVTVRSVAVTSPLDLRDGATDGGFYVQEMDGGPYSGLYVYTYADIMEAVADLGRGAVVTVTGKYTEYPSDDPAGSKAEITVTSADDLVIEQTGVELVPEPVATADLLDPASAEPWECVLVETSGIVDSIGDYGQWTVDGVLVDDVFHHAEPLVGAEVVRVAGPFDFSFGAFKVLPRDEADLEIDDSEVPVEVVTVPEIQGGAVAEGSRVRVEGVVASTGLTQPYSECSFVAFWVQDPAGGARSGIMVAVTTASVGSLVVTAGDVLTLEGTYKEHYGVSQVVLDSGADVQALSTGAAPEPITVSDTCSIGTDGGSAEDYEGVLVKVGHIAVSGTIDEIGFGQFEVDDCLLVDSLFFEYVECSGTDATPDPPDGQSIGSLTGVLHYSFDEFKLEPRSASDFQGWTP